MHILWVLAALSQISWACIPMWPGNPRCDFCGVNLKPNAGTCPTGKTCSNPVIVTQGGCLAATCPNGELVSAGLPLTSLTCQAGQWVDANGQKYMSAGCAETAPFCEEIPVTQTQPDSVQETKNSYEYTPTATTNEITNECPAGSLIRYETDQGPLFVDTPEAQSEQPICGSDGSWTTTAVDGNPRKITEEVCYAARCAECPTPTVAAGISVTTSFDDGTWCKKATFSGCPNGYRFQRGSLYVNINSPLSCVDYGAANGGRWFTPLAENTATVSCRP